MGEFPGLYRMQRGSGDYAGLTEDTVSTDSLPESY